MAKTAVFYHYFENDARYRDNLIFFLTAGYREDLEFFIVLSGECSVSLPDRHNIRYIAAENRNHDYGGYASALRELWPMPEFDHFLFINSSVRGPFLNRFQLKDWTAPFTGQLVGDRHLVGTSATALPDTSHYTAAFQSRYDYPRPYWHVQTTAYAMTAQALAHLIEIGFYDIEETLSKIDVICEYEIRLTQEILQKGWTAGCLLPEQASERSPDNFSAVNGDPLFRGGYFGRTLHPLELMFVKTNRNLYSVGELASHTCTALAGIDDPHPWKEAEILARAACEEARIAARPGVAERLKTGVRSGARRLRNLAFR